jgi:hypothetical protein
MENAKLISKVRAAVGPYLLLEAVMPNDRRTK